ncbi:carboxypeptidase-like regulatory domain-containing protein [Fodinibius salsisoli]|uniref:Carboxypeptidase regulatory-like domain-containing protein n=1 Tax=Fodinibius salsisoli TaxID=2820877 RepID=A0ABT3PQE1_9BACT|nr:carboxypeptidase-like regulatory domain-containing protein [Fodinibius salsisoli]MCW9708073.1 carboxypeptidase regulatory-like domain-containing protein [Fodinibius salsisoli]
MVIPGETLGQTGVSGTVTDEKGSPLPSAIVLVLSSADSSLVRGGITDKSGWYHL